ncbi:MULTISPECIES: hypothetical protein [unclassified Blastococcus]
MSSGPRASSCGHGGNQRTLPMSTLPLVVTAATFAAAGPHAHSLSGLPGRRAA